MRGLRWIWHELTRPRGRVRHRFYRVGRSSRAGVALLLVVTSILLLTVLVTEIVHGATVRMRMAAQHRDEVKAEALAATGVQLYRLVLMASKQIGKNPMIQQVAPLLGINGDSLWQMVPYFNTNLMRMVFVTGGDLEVDQAFAMYEGGLTDDQEARSREGSTKTRHAFLDFDGDFSASIEDEARFVFVGNLRAATLGDLLELEATRQLQGLMSGEEDRRWFNDQGIEPLELIANLVDWTDSDDTRLYQGGNEDAPYASLDSPYRPKNAPFDSLAEIRLVDGWHLDEVWERVGRHVTIYGEGKINVNTADRRVLHALLTAHADGSHHEKYIEETVNEILRYRGMSVAAGGVHFSNGQHFRNFVQNQLAASLPLKDSIVNAVTTESTVFRITSTGEVGNARVQITAVIDYSQDPTGRIVYWKVE